MSAANEYVDAALVKSTFKRLQAQRDNKVSETEHLHGDMTAQLMPI
jgi:hypothetical protein